MSEVLVSYDRHGHSGPGWYWWERGDEDAGSAGPFATEAAARGAGERMVAFQINGIRLAHALKKLRREHGYAGEVTQDRGGLTGWKLEIQGAEGSAPVDFRGCKDRKSPGYTEVLLEAAKSLDPSERSEVDVGWVLCHCVTDDDPDTADPHCDCDHGERQVPSDDEPVTAPVGIFEAIFEASSPGWYWWERGDEDAGSAGPFATEAAARGAGERIFEADLLHRRRDHVAKGLQIMEAQLTERLGSAPTLAELGRVWNRSRDLFRRLLENGQEASVAAARLREVFGAREEKLKANGGADGV